MKLFIFIYIFAFVFNAEMVDMLKVMTKRERHGVRLDNE